MGAAPPAPGLSGREAEILSLVAAGLRHKQIAARLNISPGSVCVYSARARAKLKAKSLAHAVGLAVERGLIPGPGQGVDK